MAIQFNCPFCTVTIQVPDSAGGKKGTCPQCGTKVVVPIPKNLPPTPAPAPPPGFVPPMPPPGAFVPPPGTPPMFVPPGAMPPPGFPPPAIPLGFDPNQPPPAMPNFGAVPEVGAPPPVSLPTEPPSIAKKYRRKLRSHREAMVWGAAAVSLIMAAVASYFGVFHESKSKPVTGRLTATRVANGKFEPAIVHRDWLVGIDEETLSTVLKQMEKRTVTLRSDTITLKFSGVPEGIKITAAPGGHAELVSIDPSQSKLLVSWSNQQGAKVSDRHQASVVRAGEEFIKEWAKAEASGEKVFDFNRFHESLGIAAMNKGLGSELVAIVGQTAYDCVAEQQGRLFFLLPPRTERFELQGRDHGNGHRVFNGHFIVEVVSAAPTATKPDKSEGGSDDHDGEMKPKSFGTPALNDPSATDESMPKREMKNEQ